MIGPQGNMLQVHTCHVITVANLSTFNILTEEKNNMRVYKQ